MLKIGIYLNIGSPEMGGASTLLNTIKKELKGAFNEYRFIVIYNGDGNQQYKVQSDGIDYINLTSALKEVKWNIRFDKFRYMMKHPGLGDYYYGERDSVWESIGKKEKLDLYWFTAPVIAYTSIPYIYTVWDLGHRVLPQFPEMSQPLSNWYGRENLYYRMLYRASYVITGNETGKKEILENYLIPENKIRIVGFPISSFCYGEEKKPDFALPDEYFFYPAQFWPHKNHIRIIEAVKILRDEYNTIVNVIFSGSDKGNRKYIEEMVNEYNLTTQVIFAGFVSYEEMKFLYTHANAMIFASLLGPNNMPPAEAAYLGCPVILTDIPGHREQMGDTALYFDACNSRDLAEKILEIKDNRRLVEEIKEKENKFHHDMDNYSYSREIIKIIQEFELLRRTYGEEYTTR